MDAKGENMLERREPDNDESRPRELPWQVYHDRTLKEWWSLLESDPAEGEVQEFLELHPAMVPGGSGDIGPGGHHCSEMGLLFRQPELKGLGKDRYPDFMWVTRSSGLITPILIEIEKPSKRWFTRNENPTADLTHALQQLAEWRDWFDRDNNAAGFRSRYLFEQRYDNRALEPQYLLIYGRASEFEPGGGHSDPDHLRRVRDQLRRSSESFMTFDSLHPKYEHQNSITTTMTSNGPRLFAFSPVYCTGPIMRSDAAYLGDPRSALAKSVMMSEERKTYLAQRWDYWADDHRRDSREQRHPALSMARE